MRKEIKSAEVVIDHSGYALDLLPRHYVHRVLLKQFFGLEVSLRILNVEHRFRDEAGFELKFCTILRLNLRRRNGNKVVYVAESSILLDFLRNL